MVITSRFLGIHHAHVTIDHSAGHIKRLQRHKAICHYYDVILLFALNDNKAYRLAVRRIVIYWGRRRASAVAGLRETNARLPYRRHIKAATLPLPVPKILQTSIGKCRQRRKRSTLVPKIPGKRKNVKPYF